MYSINNINIIIDKMGFETTMHDHCIYKKVIDGSLVYLLEQIDNFILACHDHKTAKKYSTSMGQK